MIRLPISRPAAGLTPETRNLTPKERNKNGIKVKGPDRRIFTTLLEIHMFTLPNQEKYPDVPVFRFSNESWRG
jgi:hypothetical protein